MVLYLLSEEFKGLFIEMCSALFIVQNKYLPPVSLSRLNTLKSQSLTLARSLCKETTEWRERRELDRQQNTDLCIPPGCPSAVCVITSLSDKELLDADPTGDDSRDAD